MAIRRPKGQRLSLKGGNTLSRSSCHLGVLGIVTLVALRLVIGFHFFSEGTTKLRDPKPFSSSFFEGAKGPFASFFRGHIWDPDGLLRLGYKPADPDDRTSYPAPTVDMSATKANWEAYRDRVASHFGFDEKQNQRSQQVLIEYSELLDAFVETYREDIVNYFQGVERRERNARDPARRDVESLRGQATDVALELRAERAKLVSKVDALWDGLERDLNEIGDPDYQRPDFEARRIGRSALDTESMDRIIPWFDTIIGLCLLAGLFTPIAGVIGAAFLAMIVASQWPGYPGTVATWSQAIEALALLHLAFAGAGRYGGFDGILRALWYRRKSPQVRN